MSNNVKDYGVIGDGVTDDTVTIQACLDLGGNWYFPKGVYKVSSTLYISKDATSLEGENMATSRISYTGNTTAIANKNPTITLKWARIKELQFYAPNITVGWVINFKSMQLSKIENVWIMGSGKVNCSGINLSANWVQTECTYNIISGCYIGLVYHGIILTDGANNNTIFQNRIQPCVSGGYGIFAYSTTSNRISCNQVMANGFEYPGKISNGIYLSAGVNGFYISGNRFEQLNTGILTMPGAVNIADIGNYYSDCLYNKK